MSRWYKTDFQIASPLGGFKMAGQDLQNPEGIKAAAEAFVAEIKAHGIEVFSVTDHNSMDMLEYVRDASKESGLTMFPGMELSTGSGSDGVHLLLIGDPEADLVTLKNRWYQAAGFSDDHPPFFGTTHIPSPRTFIEILSALPEDCVAIAPHVLTENGLASKDSIAESSMRWRSLHHDRLGAIDVGTPRDGDGFNSKFRARDLNNFPALKRLAFVATSDAYAPDKLGRHTWIRMHEPNLDSLKQALLDHEARVICDWDEKAQKGNPNACRHARIDSITLDGLSTSDKALEVAFDPRLTVLIGSRGSGKSTVIQGLRTIFGNTATLPKPIRAESDRYQEEVFGSATITAGFTEALSGSLGSARWSREEGLRVNDGATLPRARVITQKELFERTSGDSNLDQSPSANMLVLVDEALDDERVRIELSRNAQAPMHSSEFNAEHGSRVVAYTQAAEKRIDAETRLATRTELRAELDSVKRKLAALDDPSTKKALEEGASVVRDGQLVDELASQMDLVIEQLSSIEISSDVEVSTAEAKAEADELSRELATAKVEIDRLAASLSTARSAYVARQNTDGNPLADKRRDAALKRQQYEAKLAALGVDLDQYSTLQNDEKTLAKQIEELDALEKQVPQLLLSETQAWKSLDDLHKKQRLGRCAFTELISSRLQSVKFEIEPLADPVSWKASLRSSLALRIGDHIEVIDELSKWLWNDNEAVTRERMLLWRDALLRGEFGGIGTKLTPSFKKRLQDTPLSTRLSLAAERADDRLSMYFLKQGNDPEVKSSWQDVTHGSPGQRSAAMLAFILSYGDSPLVLDQPEDDLDSQLVTELVVTQLRNSRWSRQLIVVTHEANIPVNTDAEKVVVLENIGGSLQVMDRDSQPHVGPIDKPEVRRSIQDLLEGGVRAFINRERRYDNELSRYRQDLRGQRTR